MNEDAVREGLERLDDLEFAALIDMQNPQLSPYATKLDIARLVNVATKTIVAALAESSNTSHDGETTPDGRSRREG